MQVIFFSVPGLPAVFISSAPAAEEIGFSPVRERFICFHGSVCVQIVTVIVPGLPARCNFSVFHQIPFSAFYNPLRTLYLTVCTECITSAVDSCLAVQVSTTPAAEVVNRSIRINHPLIGFHGSVCIQIIFFSIPGLPAGLFYTVFVKIPGSGLLRPSGFSSCLYCLGRNGWEHICCGRCAYCQAQAKKYHCDSFSHTFFLRPCQTLTPIFLFEFRVNV